MRSYGLYPKSSNHIPNENRKYYDVIWSKFFEIVTDFNPVPVSEWADENKHDINIRENTIDIPEENGNSCKARLEKNCEVPI